MDEEAFFSPNPKTRWKYAKEWASANGWPPSRVRRLLSKIKAQDVCGIRPDEIDSLKDLPEPYQAKVKDWGKHFALYGSLNAWMVFVGPSPGGSPSTGKVDDLLDSAYHHRNPTLGRPHPSLYYPDTRGFTQKIRTWAEEGYSRGGIFHRDNEVLSNFLMLNLVKTPSGKASGIPYEKLSSGARIFWRKVIPVVRPALMVALTRDVHKALVETAPNKVEITSLPIVELNAEKQYRLPKTLFSPKKQNPILAVTVPQHPSAPYFPQKHLPLLYEYLGNCVKQARIL